MSTTATNAVPPLLPESSPPTTVLAAFRRFVRWDGFGLLLVFILLYVVLSVMAPEFLTADNQLNILQNAAFFGIVALIMTLVIISGEINISVGSMAALVASMLGVSVINLGFPMPITVVIVPAVAFVIGSLAGFMRAYFGVPPFIGPL